MSPSLRTRLFLLIVLFLVGLCWTYFIYKSLSQEKITDKLSKEIEDAETYPLDIRYIPASIREKYREDLPQAFENDWKYLQVLKEMLQGDEISKGIEFEDDFLRLYLTGNNYNIDKAFSMLLNYLQLRKNHNYFFHNVSFDFTENPAYRFISVLPRRRKDGSVTSVLRLGKWNPDEVPLEHLKQIMFLLCMQSLRNPVTQASGFNMIYDFADTGPRYIKYGTPGNLYLLHHVSFEVLPAKHVGFHLINVNFIGNFLVTLSRPFLPKFIEKIFYTHSSTEELLKFYPSSMLPVEYGGNLTDHYPKDWLRNLNKEHGNFPIGGLKNIF